LSKIDQKELASQFCKEIDDDLGYLRGNDATKREKLVNRNNSLNILSAILPLVVTFISAYVYIITQQILTFVSSFVTVIPPLLINSTKAKMEHYDRCVDLQLKFTSLKGDINRLASIGQLKDQNYTDIKNQLKDLSGTLKNAFRITPARQ